MLAPILAAAAALAPAAVVDTAAAATVLVLPPVSEDPDRADLAEGLHLELLAVTRRAPVGGLVHPKMLARVRSGYGPELDALAPKARRARLAEILGATHVVSGRLREKGYDLRLRLETFPAGDKPVRRRIRSSNIPGLLAKLPDTLGVMWAGVGVKTDALGVGDFSPPTGREAALTAYARCHRDVMAQPMGIQNPIVLDDPVLERAAAACREAIALDPDYLPPQAALALVEAFAEDRAEAERLLAVSKRSKDFLPEYWLARFWILSRHYGASQALENLEAAVERFPGFMLGRGYLAETHIALGQPDAALGVLKAYLERSPRQAYIMGLIGYAHAKRGDLEAALRWTERGLRKNPSDRRLLVEMGSRLIDAERYPEAITVLKRVVSEPGARAEAISRLGYAQLKQGQLEAAQQTIMTAIERASRPSEWRTRGRARYNLAQVWLLSGSPDNAIRQLREAVAEGFIDRRALEGKVFDKLRDHEGFARLLKTEVPRGVAPSYVTPLGRASSTAELELPEVREKLEAESDIRF